MDGIQYVRDKYFWIVGTLEGNPTKEYFVFDPDTAQPKYNGAYLNKLNILYSDLHDWDMYRSSADMLTHGFALLNISLYQRLLDTSASPAYITTNRLSLFLEIIDCWSGVFGWRVTMEPDIPEYQVTDIDIKELLSGIGRKSVSSGAVTWSDEYSYIQQTEPELVKQWNLTDVPSQSASQHVATCRTFARQARHWHKKPPTDTKSLSYLIQLIANMTVNDKGKADYDINQQQALNDYMVPKTVEERAIWQIQHPGVSNTQHMSSSNERLRWQATELQHFIIWMETLPKAHHGYPIKL